MYTSIDFCHEGTFGELVDLSHNTELRSLRIYDDSWATETPTTFIHLPQLLSRISSNQMEKIELEIILKAETDIESPSWKSIEEILAGPQFSRLREISFHLIGYVNWKTVRAYIKDQLPSCMARGLVTGLDDIRKK